MPMVWPPSYSHISFWANIIMIMCSGMDSNFSLLSSLLIIIVVHCPLWVSFSFVLSAVVVHVKQANEDNEIEYYRLRKLPYGLHSITQRTAMPFHLISSVIAVAAVAVGAFCISLVAHDTVLYGSCMYNNLICRRRRHHHRLLLLQNFIYGHR